METPKPEILIEGSEKLTSIFGHWPTFHDAEIVELHFDRGEINEATDTWNFPALTVKIVLWALTSRVNEKGFLETEHPTLASIQFSSIDDFSMNGFNYQNAIYSLQITPKPNGKSWVFDVEFSPAFGMGSKFQCDAITILNAVPWNQKSRPPVWLTEKQLSNLDDSKDH